MLSSENKKLEIYTAYLIINFLEDLRKIDFSSLITLPLTEVICSQSAKVGESKMIIATNS